MFKRNGIDVSLSFKSTKESNFRVGQIYSGWKQTSTKGRS